VLGQTVPVDEIIVVDDGSTDGTVEAIRARYESRVVIYAQTNSGVSAARNRGIREARSEWIAFLDSDDVWLPTKIERQIEAILTVGAGFGLCFTDNVFSGNPNMKQSVFQEARFHVTTGVGSMEEPTARLLAGREPFFTSSLLVRRSLLEELDGFDETLIVGEDADLVFRLSFRTKFCFVAEALAEVDRTPSRIGLCDLYTTRDDRKYESFERRYNKWLAMPEVAGSRYERPIRDTLREFRYDSAEAKIHQLKIRAVLGEIGRLRTMEKSYVAIFANLLRRKIAKIRRNRGVLEESANAQLSGKEWNVS
jgi:glycosyltransferase involved in cell wall biosynthesis